MKSQSGLNRLFGSNRFLVVFALLVAVVSWLGVARSADQITEHTISGVAIDLELPIAVLAGHALSFIGGEEFVADIIVSGPRSVVGSLGEDDFDLTLNALHITEPGTHDLTILATSPAPGNFDIVGTDPPYLADIVLDHIDSLRFEVDWEISGLANVPGYMADTPRLVPSNSVWIEGPRAELERIDRIVVAVELEEALNRPWTQDVPITLLDITGTEIDPQDTQLNLEHESLTVQIPVLRVRRLPLVLDFHNVPDDFPLARLRAQMQQSAHTVTIAGPISTMVHHHDWWLGAINLRSLSPENNVFFFDIDMPSEQFINFDNLPFVLVEFDSEEWESISFDIPAEHFTVTGHPEGYEVVVQTVALNNVTFVGDAEVVEELTLEDIVVEINLGDRELIVGPQPHPVRISVSGGELVWPVEEFGNLLVHIVVTPIEE